jgi:Na+/proline symporter
MYTYLLEDKEVSKPSRKTTIAALFAGVAVVGCVLYMGTQAVAGSSLFQGTIEVPAYTIKIANSDHQV